MATVADEQIRAIEGALGAAVPEAARDAVSQLAGALAAALRGEIPATGLPLGDLLVQLQGARVEAGGLLVGFGRGNRFGDVTIGDIVGGSKVTVNLVFGGLDQAYDVRDLRGECPYQGLEPYGYEQRQLFAGRDRLIADALGRLLPEAGAPQTVLCVTGSSGSGKSSLAQAGIVPALEARYLGEGRAVRRAVMRPGERPMEELGRALAELGLGDGDGRVGLLVIDQFEEVFTQAGVAGRDQLIAWIADPPLRAPQLHVVVTVRSDFLPQLFEHQAVYALAKGGLDVYRMRREELAGAIEAPIAQRHPDKRMERALVDRLARDASGDSAHLPLLQVALRDIWQRGALTLASYGGLADAIRERGDAVLGFIDYDGAQQIPRDGDDRAALLEILLDMVDVSLGTTRGQDTRRRRSVADVARGDTRRAGLLEVLVAARLLSRWSPLQGDAVYDTVDIVHESLITSWKTLGDAVTAGRDRLEERARFELGLRLWRADGGRLLVGPALREAEALAGRDDVALRAAEARELVRLSVAAREEAQRRELEAQQALAGARLRALRLTRALAVLLAALALVMPGLWALDRLTAWITAGPMERLDAGAIEVEGQPVDVASFEMERYEVANWQYQRCVDWRGCSPLSVIPATDGAYADYPVSEINAFQAAAYCRWVGRRLPTAAEWALAARGPQGAWYLRDGAEVNPSLLNIIFEGDDPHKAGTRPVTDYQAGATDKGIFNLAGNVVEWTATIYDNDARIPDTQSATWGGTSSDVPDWLTVAGSGYTDRVESLTAGDYLNTSPAEARPDLGFRCVVSHP